MKDWQITVMSFKPTGKWYAGGPNEEYGPTKLLKPEHRELHGFQLLDLIHKNDESVRSYTDVSGGFNPYFVHVVMVHYPEDVRNFCTYMIPAKE